MRESGTERWTLPPQHLFPYLPILPKYDSATSDDIKGNIIPEYMQLDN